jgi:hypothetical protein
MRWACWIGILGCSEYGVSGKEDPGTPDTALPPSATPEPEPEPEPEDPPACPLDAPASYDVATLPGCVREPEVGSFVPVVEWTWTDNPIHPGYQQIMASPAVGSLNDDNGDGRIDANDLPDVVFAAFSGGAYTAPGALVAVSGDGRTLWSVLEAGGAYPYSSSGVAIGDLTGDGSPSVVVSSTAGVMAVDGLGRLRWATALPSTSAYGMPSLADLEGDGRAEVIFGNHVLNADGTLRWSGTGGAGSGAFSSFAVDLDEDGRLEVVAGATVYRADGSVLWQDTSRGDGRSAVADMDLDGRPEVVHVAGGQVALHDALDGRVIWVFALTDGGGGPPTVADFDGDGLPEVGVASREVYRVLEGDGTQRWANTVQDFSSSVTGSAVFDFEGDGAAEVVYADEQTLWVYDGATGAVELAWDSHSSGTLYEYPLIVDVDGDGATEIVVPSNDYAFAGSRGITVVGDLADSWAPARRLWNQHAYHISHVSGDGRVTAGGLPSWREHNSFRAGNSEVPTGLAQPDLRPGEPVFCLDECGAERAVGWFSVENRGLAASLAFDVVVAAGGRELYRATVPELRAGDASWVGPLSVDRATFGAELQVLVDQDSERPVAECDEANNLSRLTTFPCDAGG